MTTSQMTQAEGLDHTLSLVKDGYMFIKNMSDKLQSDLFVTHLLGHKVICMTGKEAAEIFYDNERFKRQGVAPKRVQKTLFGENAIQGMDSEAHLHRKALFLSQVTKENQRNLARIFEDQLNAVVPRWVNAKEINLFDEAKSILCKSACLWAGVPLPEEEIQSRAEDFAAMVDAFGAVGPRHWRGRMARTKTEEWIKTIIENVRLDRNKAPEGSALYAMAFHRELDGKLLDSNMAAIELINILRPIVAISTYIVFTALALFENPELKNNLLSGDDKELEMFVQEVRRYYPFTPFVGAKVKKNFTWKQQQFKEGDLVMLDVYGINHDSRIWQNPYSFQPNRFQDFNDNLFEFIPQGGGDSSKGHRCPGEGFTIEIMKVTLDFLVTKIEYNIPEQDLSYDINKIPTFPKSGFIMNHIQQKQITG